jgi:hypothetical protein
VKFIRCDDAGENTAMKNDPEIKSFGMKFEFSGPRTLQRNGKVERKFQTLHRRIRAMLNGANLEGELKDLGGICDECYLFIKHYFNKIEF